MSNILLFTAGLFAGAFGSAAALYPALRRARASLTLLRTEIDSARRERGGMASELASARDLAADHAETMRAENVELRRRMDELADAIMRREGVSIPPDRDR